MKFGFSVLSTGSRAASTTMMNEFSCGVVEELRLLVLVPCELVNDFIIFILVSDKNTANSSCQ